MNQLATIYEGKEHGQETEDPKQPDPENTIKLKVLLTEAGGVPGRKAQRKCTRQELDPNQPDHGVLRLGNDQKQKKKEACQRAGKVTICPGVDSGGRARAPRVHFVDHFDFQIYHRINSFNYIDRVHSDGCVSSGACRLKSL